MADDEQLDRFAALLRDADQIVVLTGAGISTESGIPDFRGPQGVWTKDPAAERRATIQHYVADPEHRRAGVAQPAGERAASAASRTPATVALAELERRANLHTLVTQNVDGLHQAAGTSPEIVIEIHGNVHEAKCLELRLARPDGGDPRSRARRRRRPAVPRVRRHAEVGHDLVRREPRPGRPRAGATRPPRVPTCSSRSGRRSSSTRRPRSPSTRCGPAPCLVVLNAEETPFDPLAEVVIRDRLGDVLPDLVARI